MSSTFFLCPQTSTRTPQRGPRANAPRQIGGAQPIGDRPQAPPFTSLGAGSPLFFVR